jgi:predicted nuclease of restriction endonuclease-like (RecB) superfamily
MKPSLPADYARLLKEIKERVRAAQYEALKAVNKEQIDLYWDIGRMIVSRQQKGSWGRSIVQQLAADLQSEFPGVKGFSAQNLWRMKQFYQAYQNEQKLSPLVREIGWSHNLIIMMWCKDQLEQERRRAPAGAYPTGGAAQPGVQGAVGPYQAQDDLPRAVRQRKAGGELHRCAA